MKKETRYLNLNKIGLIKNKNEMLINELYFSSVHDILFLIIFNLYPFKFPLPS